MGGILAQTWEVSSQPVGSVSNACISCEIETFFRTGFLGWFLGEASGRIRKDTSCKWEVIRFGFLSSLSCLSSVYIINVGLTVFDRSPRTSSVSDDSSRGMAASASSNCGRSDQVSLRSKHHWLSFSVPNTSLAIAGMALEKKSLATLAPSTR